MSLDAYFQRIGISQPTSADLAGLCAIHAAHPAAIAFENIDALTGRAPELDRSALFSKLVQGRRGGWCFEQNAVLREVLTDLGFRVTALAAWVVWMAPPDAPARPRSHMLLRVDLDDGPYIADVGFGGWLLSQPLRLVVDEVQHTPAGAHRFLLDDGEYVLQAELPTGWMNIYRFTLEPHKPADYLSSNWFVATHPSSIFVRNLLMERLTPQARYSLINDRLTIRRPDGPPETRRIADARTFERLLDETFGVEAPAGLFARVPLGLETLAMPG